MRFQYSSFLDDLDRILAIFGTIFSFILIILGVIINRPVAMIIGFLIVISCIVWLSIRKYRSIENFPTSRFHIKFWAICFFILYTLSFLTFYLRPNLYERPLFYFILIALMAGVIACEILSAESKYTGFILVQVILLGMSITWTQNLITPSLIGIDPWYHFSLTNNIIKEGIFQLSYNYSGLPIFHLIIAITSIITTVPYKFAVLMSVSFGQIACNAFFIFLFGNYLFKNHRVGLLAALLVIISDLNIRMSYWSIPNALGAIFVIIILYVLFEKRKNTPRFVVSVLIILMMAVIILTHALMAICMAIFLFVAWSIFVFYRYFGSQTKDYFSFLIPIGFSVAMFAWWAYITNNFIYLSNFISSDYSISRGQGISKVITFPPFEMIFGSLGQNIFLTIALIGIFYMISRKGNISTFSIAIISCTPLIFVFIAYFISSDIIGYRWLFISEILISIPLALSLLLVSSSKITRSYVRNFFFLAFIGSLTFLMIMGSYGNEDNHLFIPNLGTSQYYTQAEMEGSNFFQTTTTGKLISDTSYSSYVFNYYHSLPFNQLSAETFEDGMHSGKFKQDGSIKIIRSRYVDQLQQKGYSTSIILPEIKTYLSNSGFNEIYDNSAVTGYI